MLNTVTHKQIKSLLMYSPISGIFTYRKNGNSRYTKKGMIAGGKNDQGYIQIKIKHVLYKAHRLAWLYVHGEYPMGEIDHINHNREDNRIENLRDVTRISNTRNAKRRCDNTSGVTGVNYHTPSGRWMARIGNGINRTFLGSFTRKEDAVNARGKAEIEYGYHYNHGK